MKTIYLSIVFILLASTSNFAQNKVDVKTILTKLEYPVGLWVKNNTVYLTETAGRNTSNGGKNDLISFDLKTSKKTILKKSPECSDALVVSDDKKIYLTSCVDVIPGEKGKVTIFDLLKGKENPFLDIEIASNDMFLNATGDIFIIGMSDNNTSKSLYKLPKGNYTKPIVVKEGLGRVTSVTEQNGVIYYANFTGINYIGSDGVIHEFCKKAGVNSISISANYIYYSAYQDKSVGRINLTTKADEVLISGLISPLTVRYDQASNKLYFVESGSEEANYKNGSLKVINNLEQKSTTNK